MGVTVEPATAERWTDVGEVFGRRGDDPSWDWCRTFLTPGPALLDGRPDNRRALQEEVRSAAVAPGLIAYLDGRPVGWSRVGPRRAFPGITGNRTLRGVLDDVEGAWWVACFATRPDARGRGIGAALLDGAVEHAWRNGATAVEGYPVDVAGLKAKRVGASALYTGTLRLFLAARFTEVARPSPTRPLVRIIL